MEALFHSVCLLLAYLLSWPQTMGCVEGPISILRSGSGVTAVLAGTNVFITCSSKEKCTSWIRVNNTGAIFESTSFNPLIVSVKDSGQYMCVCTINSTSQRSNATTLTVVEKLPPVRVSVDPDDLVTVEGQKVSLWCNATPSPSHPVSWVWDRYMEPLGGGRLVEVSQDRGLTLTRATQSGVYRCRASSNISGIFQEEISNDQIIFIIRLPPTISYNLAVAGLTLALLALLLLALLLMWVLRLKANDTVALQDLARSNGAAEPANTPKKRALESAADNGEIYENCKTLSKAYCDLNIDQTTGEDIYHVLN